jgi:hypothetical protein
MDSGFNAVVLLDVKLGKGIALVGGGIADITHGGSIDHVTE